MDEQRRLVLEAHYATQPRAGYSGRCEMHLPDNLTGRRVLDLLCRNGKGAFKLAERVGSDGFVLGIDPDAACIDRAVAAAPANHALGVGWHCTLSFAQGYPEVLYDVGIEDTSFDIVIANSSLNTVWDLPSALGELARVLKPGGFLYLAGIFADTPASLNEVHHFAAQGNVFGTARTREGFARLAETAGFTRCSFSREAVVAPDGSDAVQELRDRTFTTSIARVEVSD